MRLMDTDLIQKVHPDLRSLAEGYLRMPPLKDIDPLEFRSLWLRRLKEC